MRFGAVEYLAMVPEPSHPAESYRLAQRLGLGGLELQLRRDELRRDPRGMLDSPRTASLETGVAIPSLMLGEHNERGGLGDTDPAVAEAAREDVLQALDWASELGADAILVPFFFRGELGDDASLKRAATSFRALCPLAGERGVRLLYEGTLPPERVRRLAELVGSETFGCYYDPGNAVWLGRDPAEEVRALGALVARVHFKDSAGGPGDVRPGLGSVPWERFAAALREIGYDGWLIMETPGGPPELVARDASVARRVFPEITPTLAWPVLGNFSWDFGAGELDRLIETFRARGLGAVQLAGPLLEDALADPDSIPRLRRRLEEGGVRVAALAGYRNLVAPDAARRREHLAFLATCLEHAPLFGTSVVATETGTLNPDSEWLPSPENATPRARTALDAALDALLPVAERHGSMLALEGYVNNVVATLDEMGGVLERFPTQHLGVVLDPFNYLSAALLPEQDRVVREFLERFEPRFAVAHLKDVGAEGAERDTPEYGSGVFRYEPYLGFLRGRRPDLPLILEHLPLENVGAAVERLRAELGPPAASKGAHRV